MSSSRNQSSKPSGRGGNGGERKSSYHHYKKDKEKAPKSMLVASRPAVKELPILPEPPTHVDIWLRSIKPYCSQKFGDIGASIDQTTYPPIFEFEPPEEPWTELQKMKVALDIKRQSNEEIKAEENKKLFSWVSYLLPLILYENLLYT